MKVKICYIISFVDFSQQFIDIDKILDSNKFEVSYIFLSPAPPSLQKIFKEKGRVAEFIQYSGRKSLPSTTAKIFKILGKIKPDIVHTHLVDASLAGLIAAKLRNISKTIHTRHHSVENHTYHPHGVYYDKLINRFSTNIIAISNNVSDVLINMENVNPQKISIIEHGFNFDDYSYSSEKVLQMKDKYGLRTSFPVVGAISRFVEGKGAQYIIPAFKELLKEYPQAKLVLANAKGSYSSEIKKLLTESLEESQYVLIDFEKNFVELYKMFDVFIHVPINKNFEAFGQTYIEALALGIPSVFTLSGIASDFIIDRKNALIVPYENSNAIYVALKSILRDKSLKESITEQGKKDVSARFDIKRMVKQLENLYLS